MGREKKKAKLDMLEKTQNIEGKYHITLKYCTEQDCAFYPSRVSVESPLKHRE